MVNRFTFEDVDMIPDLLQWANASSQPFFMGIHTGVNHYPFELPATWNMRNYTTASQYLNNVLNTYTYLDSFLKQLLESFSKTSWYKDTLFVFVGDHGTMLYDQADMLGIVHHIHEAVFNIPIFIYGNEKPQFASKFANKQYHGTASNIDIVQTLLDALNDTFWYSSDNTPKVVHPYEGSSLFKPLQDRTTLSFSSPGMAGLTIRNKNTKFSLAQEDTSCQTTSDHKSYTTVPCKGIRKKLELYATMVVHKLQQLYNITVPNLQKRYKAIFGKEAIWLSESCASLMISNTSVKQNILWCFLWIVSFPRANVKHQNHTFLRTPKGTNCKRKNHNGNNQAYDLYLLSHWATRQHQNIWSWKARKKQFLTHTQMSYSTTKKKVFFPICKISVTLSRFHACCWWVFRARTFVLVKSRAVRGAAGRSESLYCTVEFCFITSRKKFFTKIVLQILYRMKRQQDSFHCPTPTCKSMPVPNFWKFTFREANKASETSTCWICPRSKLHCNYGTNY